MKYAFLLVISLFATLPAIADQQVQGQISQPHAHQVAPNKIIFSGIFLSLPNGGFNEFQHKVSFSADQQTADALCKKLTASQSAHASDLRREDSYGAVSVVQMNSQGEMLASKSDEFLDIVECTL